MQFIHIVGEYLLGLFVAGGDNRVYFIINLRSYFLGVIPRGAEILALEYLVMVGAEQNRTESIAHAVLHDHLSGYLRRALNIV